MTDTNAINATPPLEFVQTLSDVLAIRQSNGGHILVHLSDVLKLSEDLENYYWKEVTKRQREANFED